MKRSQISNLCGLAALVAHGACISLLGVLQSTTELSTFYSYVTNSTNGTNFLGNATDFTMLAPSNTAIKNFLASNPGALTADLIDATIQYSLLKGGFPSLSFTNTSQFVETNLVNATYSNVTGGQRVELNLDSTGQPQIISGNQSVSTSPGTELVCQGGFVHILDEFLTIPLTPILEISAANLQYFTSILATGNFLNEPNVDFVNAVVIGASDVTYFIPNSAGALANATALLKENSSTTEVQALFDYHVVTGFVGYSTELKDGMVLKTVQGDNLTITLQEGEVFVNAAKITTPDLIVSNGVVHVIDSLLNRFNESGPPPPASSTTSSTPTPTPTTPTNTNPTNSVNSPVPAPASSKSGGLSTGAKIGIGVGVSVVGLVLVAALGYFLARLRKNKHDGGWNQGNRSSGTPETEKYYVNRGTIQRQDDLGLGMPSTVMYGGDRIIPTTEGVGNTTQVSGGPDIPPKSPSRAMRDGYF